MISNLFKKYIFLFFLMSSLMLGLYFFVTKSGVEQAKEKKAIGSRLGPNHSATNLSAGSAQSETLRPDLEKEMPPETKAFLQQFKLEAEQIENLPKENADGVGAKIRASEISTESAQELAKIALSNFHPAKQKIMAVYLLTQNVAKFGSLLHNIIQQAPTDFGAPKPHSVAEARSMQEKSVKMMALEALFADARNNPAAQEELKKSIDAMQDPYLKAKAQERLNELKHQRGQ